MINNYWERDALPFGVLTDCRQIMHAQALMRASKNQPTQDLLAEERGDG